MTAITAGGMSSGAGRFTPFHPLDRRFFLVMTALIWAIILAGFGYDVVQHVTTHEAAYPLIVHVHAAAFVSWLVLFTVQVGFIEAGRPGLHRRLGVVGLVLAAAMIVLGPTAAFIVDAQKFDATHQPQTFMAIQLLDIVSFAVLTGAALLNRQAPAIHKRLMLLSLISIADAGFARWPGIAMEAWLGKTYVPEYFSFYLGTDLLLLGLGAYDLLTRKRLNPAYLPGVALIVSSHMLSVWLWLGKPPFWVAITTHLIGH